MTSLLFGALAAIPTAHAADLSFSPDRPGVGDATGTPGQGRLMIEAGAALTLDDTVSAGTSGITGRYGVDEGFEARLRLPDLVATGGDFGTGSVGLGFKVGGSVGERWSASVQPEVFVETDGGAVGGALNGNVGFGVERLGLWVHGSTTVVEAGTSALAGGGVSMAAGPGGVYVNAGHAFGGSPFVGPGGWWAVSDTVQIDAGCDVIVTGDTAIPTVLLGTSLGF